MDNENVVFDWRSRFEELMTERDALRAELAETEHARDSLKAELAKWQHNHDSMENHRDRVIKHCTTLCNERDVLVDALKFYADPINYDNGAPATLVNIGGNDFFEHDEGKIARSAIKEGGDDEKAEKR